MRTANRAGPRVLLTALTAALGVCAPPAGATWPETADLVYNTAHVLDAGEFEVGIISPLQYGVNDQLMVGIHPVLLLILAPHLAVRWRATPEGPLTIALNLEWSASFLDKVNADGSRVIADEDGNETCNRCGIPWTVQSAPTLTWEPVEGLALSVGSGPAVDVIGGVTARWMIELHASVLWLIDPDNLLMLHASMNVHPWYQHATTRPVAQLMYAHAFGTLHLGVGLAVGAFPVIVETDRAAGTDLVETLPVFPVVDLWWRL